MPPIKQNNDFQALPQKKNLKYWLNKNYIIFVVAVLIGFLGSGAALALKDRRDKAPESTAISLADNQESEPQETPAKETKNKSDKKKPVESAKKPSRENPPDSNNVGSDALITNPVYKYAGFDYYHVGGSQFVTATGASATFDQASPKLTNTAKSYNHTLIELAIQSYDEKQIVEVGWRVDPIMHGDSKPHLFVFHWVDGEGTCYDVCGFVQVSNKVFPGDSVTSGTGGNYKIHYSNSKWNIWYNNEKVGYFPASLWGGRFKKAGYIQVFGEVAKNSKGACIQMGNGILGSKPGSTKISNFNLLGSSANPSLSPYATLPFDYGAATATGMRVGGSISC